jgi:hypothetical protein
MNNSRHTMIDDLPMLEDIDTKPGLNMLPDDEKNRFQKYIRPTNNNHTPTQAGMNVPSKKQMMNIQPNHQNNEQLQRLQQYYNYMQNQNKYVENQFPYDQNNTALYANDLHQEKPPKSYYDRLRHSQNQNKVYTPENIKENEYYEPYEKLSNNSNMCPDVLKHAEECNVCSKLYKHDKTPFWIAIIFLTIICILLFKRVLEM